MRTTTSAIVPPSFVTRIEARMLHYGGMIGVRYGEPFTSTCRWAWARAGPAPSKNYRSRRNPD